MACQNCGHSVRVSKALVGRSDEPDECPECGADLTKSDETLLQKDADG